MHLPQTTDEQRAARSRGTSASARSHHGTVGPLTTETRAAIRAKVRDLVVEVARELVRVELRELVRDVVREELAAARMQHALLESDGE